jgi:hypothetical protein
MIGYLRFFKRIKIPNGWCFLEINVSNKDTNAAIVRLEVCYGDHDRIFYKTDSTDTGEKELIRRLLFHLSLCRKNKIPIITFGANELPIVRTRILFSDIRGVNLGDLKIISIEKILGDFFSIGTNNSMPTASDFAREMRFKTDNASGAEIFRDIFFGIRQLLPVDIFEG